MVDFFAQQRIMNGESTPADEEAKDDICEFCDKPWDSEYHMSDECINHDGDPYD